MEHLFKLVQNGRSKMADGFGPLFINKRRHCDITAIFDDHLRMSHIIYFHSHQTTPILIAKFQNLIAKSKFNNLTS